MIRLAIVASLAVACGGKPAPQPAAAPVANTAPQPREDPMPEPCKKPPAADNSLATPELLVIYCKHVHDMCGCTDTTCMQKRADEYHEAKSEWSTRHPNARGDLSDDDKKFMDPLIVKMAECIHRIRGDG